jgi:glutathione S-transferase
MMKLHVIPPAFGLRNTGPFGFKSELALRHLKQEFELVMSPDPRAAPKGKLPFLEDSGTVVADSELIHLYWAMVASRWLDDEWWPNIVTGFFASMPFPIRHIAPVVARRQVRQTLFLQGLGRHTQEEQDGFTRRDLDAIAKKVGDGPFLLGDKLTAFDFGIASFLAGTIDNQPATRMGAITREYTSLVDYTERVQATVGAYCREVV